MRYTYLLSVLTVGVSVIFKPVWFEVMGERLPITVLREELT